MECKRPDFDDFYKIYKDNTIQQTANHFNVHFRTVQNWSLYFKVNKIKDKIKPLQEELIEYCKCNTYKNAASKFKISVSYIEKILAEYGFKKDIKLNPKKEIYIPDKEELEKYYNISLDDSSKHFGVSKSKINSWIKKLNINSKLSKYRYLGDFNEIQKDILIGSMLGDGSLRKVNNRRNSHFSEAHSASQYNYINWKYLSLKPFSSKLNFKIIKPRYICGKYTPSSSCYFFDTFVHPYLTRLEKDWYLRNVSGEYILNENKHRIKIIPKNLELSPLILAVWFFDDGSNNSKGRQAVLNTQGFSEEDCRFLVEKLKKLNINSYVSKNCNKPIISISQTCYLDFLDIISSFAECCGMQYKVGLKNYTAPKYYKKAIK